MELEKFWLHFIFAGKNCKTCFGKFVFLPGGNLLPRLIQLIDLQKNERKGHLP